MRYEDIIQSETGHCQCGVRVDEGYNFGEDGEWLCSDCHAEQIESDDDSDEPDPSPRTDWFAVASSILGDFRRIG